MFDGHDDHIGEPVRYIQEVEVKVPATQFRMVKREYDRLKPQMKEKGMDVIGFARNVPCGAVPRLSRRHQLQDRTPHGNGPEMSFVSRISVLFPRMWSR